MIEMYMSSSMSMCKGVITTDSKSNKNGSQENNVKKSNKSK